MKPAKAVLPMNADGKALHHRFWWSLPSARLLGSKTGLYPRSGGHVGGQAPPIGLNLCLSAASLAQRVPAAIRYPTPSDCLRAAYAVLITRGSFWSDAWNIAKRLWNNFDDAPCDEAFLICNGPPCSDAPAN